MDTQTKDKIAAAAKIGYGAARCASAIALACGHGVLAITMKKPLGRSRLACHLLEAAQETLKEGIADWERLK